jgi:Fe-S cluster biosynthesis and repair protein YggX
MSFQPFQNDLGRRAYENICGVCWGEWLKTQQQLINHYGLNLREPQAKEFLFRNMEQHLFGGGAEGQVGRADIEGGVPGPIGGGPQGP